MFGAFFQANFADFLPHEQFLDFCVMTVCKKNCAKFLAKMAAVGYKVLVSTIYRIGKVGFGPFAAALLER